MAADADSNEVCILNRNGKRVNIFSLELLEHDGYLSIAELSDGNIAVCAYKYVKVFTINGDFVGELDHIRIK